MKKKTIICVLGCALALMSCRNEQKGEGYIGPSDISVEGGVLTPEIMLNLGRLSDPQLSPDGTRILYGVSYSSIEQNRSCRNLFMCRPDGSDKVQLTRFGKSVSCARWTPDGKAILFIQGGQIYRAPLKGDKLGKAVKMSEVPAGINEFKLSPDGSNILYVSSVPGPVKTAVSVDPRLVKANVYIAEDLMYRHWDHWVTSTPRTFVAPFAGAKVTPENSVDILGTQELYELPTEPFSGIEQLDWSPDGRFIAYSCRKKVGKDYAFSTDTEIYVYCLSTGECKRIEMDGGYDTDPVWSPDGRHIAWISMEREGYEADRTRLMLQEVNYEGENGFSFGQRRELTENFPYFAAGPVWSEDSRTVYFNALAEGLQALWAADIDGNVRRLTKDSWWFDFSSPFALSEIGGTLHLYATYCSMQMPSEIVDVMLEGDNVDCMQISFENSRILDALAPCRTELRYVETVDGKQMLTWVLLPPEFDASRQYPAIEMCLGGPQGTLSQGWSYRWNYYLMASQGYVVVLPNRRGTTAFGPEWCEQISGDYIGLNMQDYLSAARMIKAEPYVSGVAAVGASYGGYSVYYLAGIHEDMYDCFIAHAGIFDEAGLYYTTEEMWFPEWDNGGLGRGYLSGSPWSRYIEAQRHYSNSPLKNVQKWHTPILCTHGGMDFRIPYTQALAAFNCAQMMGVPSKLAIFPDENHWILQPQNALCWHDTYFDWLDRWMKK
ncbi:MAG: S9 family peptidase [Bacteroidia bacterium]|nr:S9 family peptidase [Bacteroidia bacterium]